MTPDGSVCANCQSTLDRWCRELGQVEQDAQLLIIDQHVYREVRNIIAANPTARQPSEFHEWMDTAYPAAAVMAIGRLIDRDRRSVSFRNLLCEMKDNARLFSIERHVHMYAEANPNLPKDHVRDMAKGDFKRWLERTGLGSRVGPGEVLVTDEPSCSFNLTPHEVSCRVAAIIDEDVKKLDSFTALVKKYRDKRVAHKDKQPFNEAITHHDLESAISCIEKLVLRYNFLLEGGSQDTLLPRWQYDWKRIFRAAWLQKE